MSVTGVSKTTLAVFRSDSRRVWIWITLGLTTLSVLTWTEWLKALPRGEGMNPDRWPLIALYIVWSGMTAQLVLGDPPEVVAGARAAPWDKRVSAKALFVLTWVGLPLVVSQMALVCFFGGPIAANLGPAVETAAATILFIGVTAAAFASVTRELWQWLLCMAGALILMAALAFVGDAARGDGHVPTGMDIADLLEAFAFAGLAIFGIAARYARPRSRIGLLAILAAVVSVPLIEMGTPFRAILLEQFPLISWEKAPFRIELAGLAGDDIRLRYPMDAGDSTV